MTTNTRRRRSGGTILAGAPPVLTSRADPAHPWKGRPMALGFLVDRIAEMGPAAMADPLVAGINAQLAVNEGLLQHRDHGAIDGRDAGFIDGFGLAPRHTAARWREYRDSPAAAELDAAGYDVRTDPDLLP
ncbi:hypothetical protein AB0J01_27810 [Streptomyces sp. NPDC050204]|uniref:hypothetical protein n=1 Tax=Streptomyces sp. NPDC050204 TaxID=3155514 RepID=UPI003430C8D8